jgi:transposase-like protein
MEITTLEEMMQLYFSEENASDEHRKIAEVRAIEKMKEIKWGERKNTCPYCNSLDFSIESERRDESKCKKCFQVYNVKTNTILECSNIKVGDWLCLIWIIANKENNANNKKSGWTKSIAKRLNISYNSILKRIKEIERIERENSIFDRLPQDYESDEVRIISKFEELITYRHQVLDIRELFPNWDEVHKRL